MRVLIVEDEPEANRLLSMLVQLRGYRTESAYTGGEETVDIPGATVTATLENLTAAYVNNVADRNLEVTPGQ